MKKILAITLVALMALSLFGAVGASAVDVESKMSPALIEEISSIPADLPIGVRGMLNVDFSGYLTATEYFEEIGADMERLDADEEYRAQMYEEYEQECRVPFAASIDEQLAPAFLEVFGSEKPVEVTVDYSYDEDYKPYDFFFTATSDKVLLMAQQDVVRFLDVAYSSISREENELLLRYLDAMGIDPIHKSDYNPIILAKVSGYTLFMCDFWVVNDAIATELFGDVIIENGPIGNYDNIINILTEGPEGNFSTLTAEYEAGRLDIHEVYRALKDNDYAPCAYYLGDVDRDGYLTVKDATRMQKVLAKMPVAGGVSRKEKVMQDANFDGVFNVKDATHVQKKVAGIELVCESI